MPAFVPQQSHLKTAEGYRKQLVKRHKNADASGLVFKMCLKIPTDTSTHE